MALASQYISDIRSLVHDLTTQDWSDTELLNWLNQARRRVALDTHCVRQLYVGNLITQQEQYASTNSIMGVVVTNGGSGYTTAPSVTLSAPPAGGVQATATAVVSTAGVVTQILMTNWGSGYNAVPTVTIGGPGVNAAGTAQAMLNTLDVISVTLLFPGLAQGQMLNWYNWTVFQAWLRFNRQQFGFPAAWTEYQETRTLFFGRPPDQQYVAEIDTAIQATDLPATTSTETQIQSPYDDALKYWGAHMALLKLQNFEHAEKMEAKYDKRIKQILLTKQGRRITSIYTNTYRRMMRGW